MNILIVGFGGMGCRHAQALLSLPTIPKIWAIEPNEAYFKTCLSNIGSNETQVTRIDWNELKNLKLDFAIVATSAEPRFDIVKKLIELGVKNLLVEKVVFQANQQFKEITELANKNGVRAHCNFVHREVPNYKQLREQIKSSGLPITMLVQGGDFGIGCNGLHYMDLFEYISGSKLKLTSSLLHQHPNGNKRGAQYKELLGSVSGVSVKGDKFAMSSDDRHHGAIIINILLGDKIYQFNEGSQTELVIAGNMTQQTEFKLIPTSRLTHKIAAEIMEGKTVLPSIHDTWNIHEQFFNVLNPVFGCSNVNDQNAVLCPIT